MLNSGKMYTRLKGNCGMEGKQKDGYQRKVDKSLIPTCNIMGVNIAAINMEWLLEYLKKNLKRQKMDK